MGDVLLEKGVGRVACRDGGGEQRLGVGPPQHRPGGKRHLRFPCILSGRGKRGGQRCDMCVCKARDGERRGRDRGGGGIGGRDIRSGIQLNKDKTGTEGVEGQERPGCDCRVYYYNFEGQG